MSTLELHITLRSIFNRPYQATATLSRSDNVNTELTRGALKFIETEVLHEDVSKVYKGIVRDDNGFSKNVVCKLVKFSCMNDADPDWCEHEADIYNNHLAKLQGKYIPRFYGLFEGYVEEESAACLLLEDCGVVPTAKLLSAHVELRVTLMRTLMAIHKAGFQHNDFVIRNFLVDSLEKPTRIVVIDFEAASPHECRHPMEFPVFAKPWKSLTCREIRDIARGLELSTPVYLSHLGQIFLVKSFKNAEELAQMGPQPITMSDDAILAMANAAIAEYNRKWGDKEKYASGKEKWIVYPAGDD